LSVIDCATTATARLILAASEWLNAAKGDPFHLERISVLAPLPHDGTFAERARCRTRFLHKIKG
jgi:hypothetical protein